MAEEAARRTASLETQKEAPSPPVYVLRHVDVNNATESELSYVASIGPVVAAQILEERNKGRFENWADLVRRVAGLSSAQNAAYASVSGLNVDGQSLSGAPPDAAIAAKIAERYQKYERP